MTCNPFKKLMPLTLLAVNLMACSGPSVGAPENDYVVIPVTQEVIAKQQADNQPAVVPQITLPAAASEYSYKIGPGDLLFLRLSVPSLDPEDLRMQQVYPTSQELSDKDNSQEVNADGTVSFPYIGKIKVAGKTSDELIDHLRVRYKEYIRTPHVELRVLEYKSHYTTVAGGVDKPGRQAIGNVPKTVLDAVGEAGGVKDTADLRDSYILHADGSRTPVDLQALLYGSGASNPNLRSGDVLHVPFRTGNSVYLSGEVLRPQRLPIPQGQKLTVEDAIYMAGGPQMVTADNEIYVVRGLDEDQKNDASKPSLNIYTLKLKDMHSMMLATRFELAPRDVVYVATRPVTQWSRFISQLIPGNLNSMLSPVRVGNE